MSENSGFLLMLLFGFLNSLPELLDCADLR